MVIVNSFSSFKGGPDTTVISVVTVSVITKLTKSSPIMTCATNSPTTTNIRLPRPNGPMDGYLTTTMLARKLTTTALNPSADGNRPILTSRPVSHSTSDTNPATESNTE